MMSDVTFITNNRCDGNYNVITELTKRDEDIRWTARIISVLHSGVQLFLQLPSQVAVRSFQRPIRK
jgi:hypothetical protein